MWGPRCFAIVVAGLLPASSVASDEPIEGEADDYGRWVDLAIDEFAAGRHQEALAAFRRAHDRSPSARTLRGMAMASYELSEYPEALRYAEAALSSERLPLTPELRDHVLSLVERVRAFIGVYSLEVTPPHGAVSVDGARAEPTGARLILGLGVHRIVFEAQGYERAERTVTVRGGEHTELRVHLEGGPPSALDPPVLRIPPPEPSSGDRTIVDVAVAFIIAALASVGLAAVAGGLLTWREDVLDDCGVHPGACENTTALRLERDLLLAASVGLPILAGGLGATGVGLLLAYP